VPVRPLPQPLPYEERGASPLPLPLQGRGLGGWVVFRRQRRLGDYMKRKHIITGQRIDPAKLAHAKALRRQMTPAEKLLWSRLRRNQLDYHFRRQQVIAGFIVDFYGDAARLVVEVDGGVHEQQADYDESRAEVFTRWGISILRLTNEEVLEKLEETLAHIKEMCQACS